MSQENSIKCPHCGNRIDINSVLYHDLESKLKKEFEQERVKHRQEYKNAMEALKQKQNEFIKEKEVQEERFEEELKKRVKEQRVNLEMSIKKEAAQEQQEAINKLKEELNQKSEQVKELNASKIEIERLKREKEEATQIATLKAEQELNKKLEFEREKIQKHISEQSDMKLKQKEEQIEQIKRQLEEAKRKSEQSSQQIQGEAGEHIIEEWLQGNYPFDEIQEIKKGQRGGDCLQIVNTREMLGCGSIYYESKNTKEFQPSWIEKFKADIRDKGADVGVLITSVMPKDMPNMGVIDGVWVCNFSEFKGLSMALREGVIKVARASKSQENRSDKMTLLYSYLTSNEFKMQIEAIVEGFVSMQSGLESEKRAMNRIWKEREKQILKVLDNTTALYGSVKGIAGNAVAHISSLELPFEQDE